jgi:hypothetical protein
MGKNRVETEFLTGTRPVINYPNVFRVMCIIFFCASANAVMLKFTDLVSLHYGWLLGVIYILLSTYVAILALTYPNMCSTLREKLTKQHNEIVMLNTRIEFMETMGKTEDNRNE